MLLGEVPDSQAYGIFNKVFEKRARGEDVVSLAIGEPSFKTPSEIVDAAHRSMQRGETHYAPSLGTPEVREAIWKKVNRKNGIAADVGNTVFVSAKLAVFAALAAVCGEGAHVLVPDPGYYYSDPALLAGGRPLRYGLAPDFSLDLEALRREATGKTAAVVLNTPSNPTGKVVDKRQLEELYEFCREKKIHIISDESYEDLVYGKKHVSIGSFEESPEWVISIFTLSKSYSMTGWRAGYAIADTRLVKLINRFLENSVTCFPPFIQSASAYALNRGDAFIEGFRSELLKRKGIIEREMKAIPGIEFREAEGAFYSFPRVAGEADSAALCARLLEQENLALLPGTLFGSAGEGHLRISFSEPPAVIREGMKRLRAFMAAENPRRAGQKPR